MSDYLQFAFLMLVGQLSPGPDMLVITKNSFNHGLRAALLTIAGIISGIVLHTTLALLGLAYIFAKENPAHRYLKFAGAAYLFYLGAKIIHATLKESSAAEKVKDNSEQKAPAPGGVTPLADLQAFSQGLLTNLLNPKVILIISTILLMFIDHDSSAAEKITYGTILVIEGLVVWILFALALQTRPAKEQFQRWEKPINLTFGVLLIALALRTAVG